MSCSNRFEMLVATHNPGKIREIQRALHFLPIKLHYLNEFPSVSPVDEVGQTYQENAVRKALDYARQTGVSSLADDSGLEVDALDGMPGIFSARFAGNHASDGARIERVLMELSEYPDRKRTGRFVCCIALAGWQPSERAINKTDPYLLTVTEAKCEGVITTSPRGLHGFGFDPIFVPLGYEATFGELSPDVKATIGHRGLALASMRSFIEQWLRLTCPLLQAHLECSLLRWVVRGVAQPGSALGLGPRGRRFKSSRPDH